METLQKKIAKLPENLKLRVEGYVDALLTEALHQQSDSDVTERKFGGLKGFVTYISDDFDEPLDDFKDYM